MSVFIAIKKFNTVFNQNKPNFSLLNEFTAPQHINYINIIDF